METIFNGGEGGRGGGWGGGEGGGGRRDDGVDTQTNLENKKDILSTMICIHFINLLCKVDKPYFFLLKSDQLIGIHVYWYIPVYRYAGTPVGSKYKYRKWYQS